MHHKTFENRPIEIAYYMYDRKFNTFEKFNTLSDLLTHVAKITKYHWHPKYYKFYYDTLYSFLENQNITGNDITVEHKFNFATYEYDININEKRFTFYVQHLDQKLHVIDLSKYVEEIEEIQNDSDLYSNSNHYNWCKEYRYKPYQKISHHKKEQYMIDKTDEYYEEYFKSASPRKRGKDKSYNYWSKWYTSSQRCWKKQTKQKHQYGNRTRNKFLESDFFKLESDGYYDLIYT